MWKCTWTSCLADGGILRINTFASRTCPRALRERVILGRTGGQGQCRVGIFCLSHLFLRHPRLRGRLEPRVAILRGESILAADGRCTSNAVARGPRSLSSLRERGLLPRTGPSPSLAN